MGAETGTTFYAPAPKGSFLNECQQVVKPLKIAYCTELKACQRVHPDCAKAVALAVKLCHEAGHELIEVSLDKYINREIIDHYLTIVMAEVAAMIDGLSIRAGHKPKSNELENTTQVLARIGRIFSASDYAKSSYAIDMLTRKIGYLLQKFAVILTPTMATPPLPIGVFEPNRVENVWLSLLRRLPIRTMLKSMFGQLGEKLLSCIPFTPLANITGLPAMSVPLYWNDAGLPIGCQFIAAYAGEPILFRLASQLEQQQPWFAKRPVL